MDFYRDVLKNREEVPQLLLTLLAGGREKLSLSYLDGTLLAATHPDGFLASQLSVLSSLVQEGGRAPFLYTVDGQEVFCERLGGVDHMVICGGGHVSLPVVHLAKMAGFLVSVLEDRPEFAERAKEAGADEVICAPFDRGMDSITYRDNMYYIVVTRGHQYDKMCLEKILKKPYLYLGVMGSRRRAVRLFGELEKEGYGRNELERICLPIGLPIGAETPEEIAISILAEVVSFRNRMGSGSFFTREVVSGLQKTGKKVSAVIVGKSGSAPRSVGTRMILCEDGSQFGTVGGGLFEARIREVSLEMMRETGEKSNCGSVYQQEIAGSKRIRIDMTGKQAGAEGLVCGGTMEVLLELCL